MYSSRLIASLILALTFLSACNDRIVDEAEKIQNQMNEELQMQEELLEKQLQALEENEITIEEAVEDIQEDRETKKTMEKRKVTEQKEFSDPEDFAQYVSDVLYRFYIGEISADKYFEFLMDHGSRVLLKDIDVENREEMIKGYAAIQVSLAEREITFTDYKTSELTFDGPKIYAHFYRTLITKEGEEVSYLTTIVKEKNTWKFDSDILSPGYIEEGKDGNNDFK